MLKILDLDLYIKKLGWILTSYAERGSGHQFHPVEGIIAIAGTQKLHAYCTGMIDQRKIGSFVPAGAEDLHEFVSVRVGTQRTGHNGQTWMWHNELLSKGFLTFPRDRCLPSDVVSTARALVSQRQLLVPKWVAFRVFFGLCLLRKMALRRT